MGNLLVMVPSNGILAAVTKKYHDSFDISYASHDSPLRDIIALHFGHIGDGVYSAGGYGKKKDATFRIAQGGEAVIDERTKTVIKIVDRGRVKVLEGYPEVEILYIAGILSTPELTAQLK
jgi:hypothetical protein